MSAQVVATGASAQASTVTTRAATLNAAVSVGDLIFVATTRSNPANLDTYGSDTCADQLGNTYTQISQHVFDNSDGQGLTAWWCKVTVAGTPTITVTFNESSNFAGLVAAAFNPVRTLDVSASNTPRVVLIEGGTVVTVDPTGGGELFVLAHANGSNNNMLPPAGELAQDQVIGHLIWLSHAVIARDTAYAAQVGSVPPSSTGILAIGAFFTLDSDDPILAVSDSVTDRARPRIGAF